MRLIFLIFIFPFLQVEGFFTIVGSRTFVFGNDYELFLTRNHDEKFNLVLHLKLTGSKFGEEFDKTIPLDFQQKLVKFDVSLLKTNQILSSPNSPLTFTSASTTSNSRKFHFNRKSSQFRSIC